MRHIRLRSLSNPLTARAVPAWLALGTGSLIAAVAAGPHVQRVSCLLPRSPGDSVGITTYCAELVPVPELRTVRAVLELSPPTGPFVPVTTTGESRYELGVRIEGLPDPPDLGPYTTYIAWLTDLSTANPERLGPVANGVTALGTVARNQFRIIITAEAREAVQERTGRIVLRGTSPSVRFLAHRDLILATSPGFGRPGDGHMRAGNSWTMPPMDPAMPVMPGFQSLLPDVEPFIPVASGDVPEVRPSRPVRLRDGDTLWLEAGLVHRRIGDRVLAMYAFNGQQPGPLIRVDQGSTIVVEFHNALDLPTTVHWHGVRLDNRFDGAAGVTQDPVQPGGRFEYHVHFRDEGIYWYHPHVREDIEQDLGLYGNMLAAPSNGDAYGPSNREEFLIVDDFLMGDDGWPVPWGREAPTHALMGRFGNVFLTNGEPEYDLTVSTGEVVRFYITNVASSRIFNLSFDGAPVKLVGGDIGRYEREQWVGSIVLAPAERAIVDVRFSRPGRVALVNRVQSASHMLGTFMPEVDTLGTVAVRGTNAGPDLTAAYEQLRTNSDVVADIDRYRAWFDRPPDRRLLLRMDASKLSGALMSSMLVGWAPPVDWNDGMPMLNWLITGRDVRWTLQDAETLRENRDIGWRFHVGDIVKIEITNPPEAFHPMSHPIHLHGQRFLVVKRNGRPVTNLVWKDTVIVPVGERVEIVLDLTNPGVWMLHCHIAEHLGSGMMTTFEVLP